MSQLSLFHPSFQRQIFHLIQRIILERKAEGSINSILMEEPENIGLINDAFFSIGFMREITVSGVSLLHNKDRQEIFSRMLREEFHRRRLNHTLMNIMPKKTGKDEDESFDREALLHLLRFTNEILTAFEKDVMKKMIERKKRMTEDVEKLKKLDGDLENLENTFLVLTYEGLKAFEDGIPLVTILDNGWITYLSLDELENDLKTGTLPEDVAMDENGNIFPVFPLWVKLGENFVETQTFESEGAISIKDGETQGFSLAEVFIGEGFRANGALLYDVENNGVLIRGDYMDDDGESAFQYDIKAHQIIRGEIGKTRADVSRTPVKGKALPEEGASPETMPAKEMKDESSMNQPKGEAMEIPSMHFDEPKTPDMQFHAEPDSIFGKGVKIQVPEMSQQRPIKPLRQMPIPQGSTAKDQELEHEADHARTQLADAKIPTEMPKTAYENAQLREEGKKQTQNPKRAPQQRGGQESPQMNRSGQRSKKPKKQGILGQFFGHPMGQSVTAAAGFGFLYFG